MRENVLTIGQLAKQAEVGVETVRFYERKGLIKKPAKSSGFRKYTFETVKRIKFIKRAQELGFTLKEVASLLDLRLGAKSTCGDVQQKAESKILEVNQKIQDLKRIKRSLQNLAKACKNKSASVSECPILDSFETGVRN